MTLIFPIEDFLYELFPVEKDDLKHLHDFLKRYYSEGPFEPTVEISSGIVKVTKLISIAYLNQIIYVTNALGIKIS